MAKSRDEPNFHCDAALAIAGSSLGCQGRAAARPADLKIGQTLQGRVGSYTIREQLRRRIWAAMSSTSQRVTVKTAADWPLKNECEVLKAVRNNPYIRPIIDASDDPPSLILSHLEDNLLNASNAKTLERADIKFVARNILQALDALHSRGYVHTDVKPDKILVNYGTAPDGFSEVQLGDCGDAFMVDPNASPSEEGHIIAVAIFRSPEAMLNLRWRPTSGLLEQLDEYPLQVPIRQVSIFAPVSLSYEEIADGESLGFLKVVHDHKLQKPFHLSDDKELSEEDRTFICKIMKLDPRDRPTAKELLKDELFRQE